MADKSKKNKVVAGFQFQPVSSKASSASSASGSTSTGKRGRADQSSGPTDTAAATEVKRPSLLEGLPSYPSIPAVSRPPNACAPADRLGTYVEAVLQSHVDGVGRTYAQFAHVGSHVADIVSSFVDGPLRDSLAQEAAGHAEREQKSGYRNVKNIEHAAAAAALEKDLKRATAEAAQWRSAAQRVDDVQDDGDVVITVAPDDALIKKHSEALDALSTTLSVSLPEYLLQIDAVARALRASGDVLDTAHALTRRTAAALRTRAFADFAPGTSSIADARSVIRGAVKGGLAPASTADALAAIVGEDAYDTIQRLAEDATEGGAVAAKVKSPDAIRSVAAAFTAPPTPGNAARRGRGRGRAAAASVVEDDEFEDAQGGAAAGGRACLKLRPASSSASAEDVGISNRQPWCVLNIVLCAMRIYLQT